MNFFKSVFADETSDSDDPDDAVSLPEHPAPTTDAWSFGGLIKTLATKSETVIQTYRKDLEEFGSGLREETAVIRSVASRAVKDLPASLEAGAAVAQESLESVGQAIDDIGASVWKSTAEIVAQGKESISADDDGDDEDDGSSVGLDSKPYNRFESQLRAVQSSAGTFLDEPEDSESFEQWRLEFVLEDRSEEIEALVKENVDIGEIFASFVPEKVDQESFWVRYFYKVHKLKEIEDARLKLVKRAISGEEEEELSWDFDDDEEEVEEEEIKEVSNVVDVDKSEPLKASDDSGKESDISIVSRPEEEDLGWDEIEDVASGDEVKTVDSDSTKPDPVKRLSNAVEEEDLNWDIEDEDDDDNEAKKSG